MKGIVMTVCVFMIGFSIMAQDTKAFKFIGTVTDKTDQSPLEDYIVDVYEGNTIVSSPEVGKKGKFEAELFGSSKYTIDISMEGYYPKRVVVDTDVPADIKKMTPFKFEIELIRKSEYELIENVDPFATSIFDFPYVMFEYNSGFEDWHFREAYTEHIKEEYAKVGDVR